MTHYRRISMEKHVQRSSEPHQDSVAPCDNLDFVRPCFSGKTDLTVVRVVRMNVSRVIINPL